MKPDNIHYNLSKILSYQKPFVSVISAREGGKTTAAWRHAYKQYKENHTTTIVIRRLITDITSTYIEDIQSVLNKFDIPVQFKYAKGGLKQGIVDVYIDDGSKQGDLFFRVIALSNPMSRIKSLMMPRLGLIIFDEFICNNRLGEKYLYDEAFKFREIYNTFQREAEPGLVCIFLGNPYSLFNPYFAWWKVPTDELYPGQIVVGDNWAVECYQLTNELREFILKRNPLYRFDDSYTAYAFDGRNINDEMINIVKDQPEGYKLKHVFRYEGTYIGCFKAPTYDTNMKFWCKQIDYVGENRRIYCFDFGQLVQGVVLFSSVDRENFAPLKNAMRARKVAYKDVGTAYAMEQIFTYI